MAQRRRGGNNNDGWRDGNGNGWCNNEVVAMTVMDGTMAMAIAR
jgi:hypothetical protein